MNLEERGQTPLASPTEYYGGMRGGMGGYGNMHQGLDAGLCTPGVTPLNPHKFVWSSAGHGGALGVSQVGHRAELHNPVVFDEHGVGVPNVDLLGLGENGAGGVAGVGAPMPGQMNGKQLRDANDLEGRRSRLNANFCANVNISGATPA